MADNSALAFILDGTASLTTKEEFDAVIQAVRNQRAVLCGCRTRRLLTDEGRPRTG
jgi:hypothetical protein